MGLLIGFMPLMGWRAVKGPMLESCEFSRVMDYNYLVFLYLATIILPALFMATSYAHIYTVIIKQVSDTNAFSITTVCMFNTNSCDTIIDVTICTPWWHIYNSSIRCFCVFFLKSQSSIIADRKTNTLCFGTLFLDIRFG